MVVGERLKNWWLVSPIHDEMSDAVEAKKAKTTLKDSKLNVNHLLLAIRKYLESKSEPIVLELFLEGTEVYDSMSVFLAQMRRTCNQELIMDCKFSYGASFETKMEENVARIAMLLQF